LATDWKTSLHQRIWAKTNVLHRLMFKNKIEKSLENRTKNSKIT